MWENKCLLLTITVMWTWSVSHSFVVILDLLILVEDIVSQPGLHCQACFERTCVFISGYVAILFYCIKNCIYIKWIACCLLDFFILHQYLRVAMQLLFKGPVSSLSLSCPYHLFHCLSGIFNKAFSFNGQNIAIKFFIVCVMQYLHNSKAFIKIKCVSILWLS